MVKRAKKVKKGEKEQTAKKRTEVEGDFVQFIAG